MGQGEPGDSLENYSIRNEESDPNTPFDVVIFNAENCILRSSREFRKVSRSQSLVFAVSDLQAAMCRVSILQYSNSLYPGSAVNLQRILQEE